MAAEALLPRPLALIVCDNVNFDRSNGKFHIVGTCEMIAAPQFPAAGRLGVYCVLTNCHGKHHLQIKFICAGEDGEDEEIVSEGMDISETDPIKTVQISYDLAVSIPRAGVYFIQICSAEAGCIIERRLVAQQLPQPPGQKP